jgi:hypothetical protein
MKTAEIMFSLIGLALTGRSVDDAVLDSIDENTLLSLYELSNKHDLSHIIAEALTTLGIKAEGEIMKKLERKQLVAIYRYEQIRYETESIREALEAAEIPFILLKGAKIREYYPEPFMRTSCDIDVLVNEKDLKRATLVLENNLLYTTNNKINFHDVSLYSKSGVHIELHHSIKENMEKMDKVLDAVWENSYPVSNGSYQYEQSAEYLYFHAVAHMAYHFLAGGCGVRSFLDLYLLNKKEMNMKKRDSLLLEAGLLQFEKEALRLACVWLDGGAHTESTSLMEEYILFGGAYGTLGGRVKVNQAKKGSRIGYILSRIWLPYKSIKTLYPILAEHKWLTPFYQVRRWLGLLFSDKRKRGRLELKKSADISRKENEKMGKLLLTLGLRQ